MTLMAVSKTPEPASFSIWAGSVIGREHVRLRRNNQDAAAFAVGKEALVAVVADGCSASRASEVGAKLGAEWVAANAPALLPRLRSARPEVCAEAIARGLVRYLGAILSALPPDALADMFLFTLLVAVVERERAFVFGVGDGAVVINGRLIAAHEETPPYLAYRLAGANAVALAPYAQSLRPVVRWSGTSGEVESLAIGTDGLLELDEAARANVLEDPAYAHNATLLHKKLASLSETTRKICDDTTVVLIRRAAPVSREAR